MESQCTGELGHVGKFMTIEVVLYTLINFFANQGIVEKRRTDTHSRGTRDEEFQRILGGRDAALTDDRDIMFAAHLVNLVDLEQRDGLNCGP